MAHPDLTRVFTQKMFQETDSPKCHVVLFDQSCFVADCQFSNFSCPERYSWKCHSDHTCLRNEFFCDGINNCLDASDEIHCQDLPCLGNHVKCGNLERCIEVNHLLFQFEIAS